MKNIFLFLLDKLANISMLVGIAFILFLGVMDISIFDIETVPIILSYSAIIWALSRLLYKIILGGKVMLYR